MAEPFAPGARVLITLSAPREKFWGAVLALNPAGISVRGVDLHSIDDFARQLKAGENAAAATVFFPMHRVEKVELDVRSGEIPSLAERVAEKSGYPADQILGVPARE